MLFLSHLCKVAEYKANRSKITFTDSDCDQFRQRLLKAIRIDFDGVLWCHFCGPMLAVMTQHEAVLRYSRLFPLNGENHLVCESCFQKYKSNVNLEEECIKVCKSLCLQIEVRHIFFSLSI